MQEFNAEPMSCYWLRLSLRLWDQLATHECDTVNTAFKDNVRLAGLGLNTTWAHNLLHTVERLDPGRLACLPGLHYMPSVLILII